MRRRPVARATAGVAVATVALMSVFAGTAWAPKITLMPLTRADCRADGWETLGFRSVEWCLLAVHLADTKARIEALLDRLEENGSL